MRLGKYLAKNFVVSYRYSLIGPRNEQWNLALKLDAGNAALRDKIARGSL